MERLAELNTRGGWKRAGRLLRAALGILLAVGGGATARAQSNTPRPETWITNGPVYAIAQTTDTIYLGGDFTTVGPYTGNGVTLDNTSGESTTSLATLATVNGPVYASVAAQGGGWLIGGAFTKVGGVTRNGLAHINPDGSLDTAWDPHVNGTVYALAYDALATSTTLYVGGNFTQIGGANRNCIAALDAVTRGVRTWNPGANGTVRAIALRKQGNPGDHYSYSICAGGDFTQIGGQTRNHLAELASADPGQATAWDPNLDGTVNALASYEQNVDYPIPNGSFTTPNGITLYVGGAFSHAGGVARNRAAAFDFSSGALTRWDPNPSDDYTHLEVVVNAFAISEAVDTTWRVYIGGQFRAIGGKTRNALAAVDITSGTALDWDAGVSGLHDYSPAAVHALSTPEAGAKLCIGGNFTQVGGQARQNLALLDLVNGDVKAWAPDTNDTVYTVETGGMTYYAGGRFTSAHVKPRNYLAALDSATGAATAWNPGANGTVRSLAASHGTVYAGGEFSTIGGQTRHGIAALNARSGLATAWDPAADGPVYALAATSATVYAGGNFAHIGRQARNYLAALDAASGDATPWDPNAGQVVKTYPDTMITALAVAGPVVYAAGYFTLIGGQARNYLAALDAAGHATGWDPNIRNLNTISGEVYDGWVSTVAVVGSTVYFGGQFTDVGPQRRLYIAAADAATAAPTAWNPGATGHINSLAVAGTKIFAGGFFAGVGNQQRFCLAGLDLTTSTVSAWNPDPDGTVYCVSATDSSLCAGGQFWKLAGANRSFFGQYALVQKPKIVTQPATQDVVMGTTVNFSVTATGAGPLTYQWKKGGVDLKNTLLITGVTSSTLTIKGVMEGDEGGYACVVTNDGGSQASDPAILTVKDPPAILFHPVAQTVNPGVTVSFSVTATGVGPLSYRWKRGTLSLFPSERIADVTSSTLIITGVQQADEGSYSCTVSNGGGHRVSNQAILSVNDPPGISIQPFPKTVNPGATVTFSILASGTTPLTYQWKNGTTALKSDSRISGATSRTLTLQSAQYADSGLYSCVVGNMAGTSTSQAARLVVNPSLAIVSAYGSPSPAVGRAVYTSGTQVNARINTTTLQDAAGTTRRVLTGWKAVGAAPASGSGGSITFRIDRPTTITWQWKTQYKLVVTPVPAAGGSVTLGDGVTAASGWFDAGTTLSLRPKYNPYYRFVAWWGDVHNAASPLSLKMDQPGTLTAQFKDLRNGVADWLGYR